MQMQAEPAIRSFRSPAFAAYHAQRLSELSTRVEYLCTVAWDINAAWQVRDDVQTLIGQMLRSEPEADASAWQAFADGFGEAIDLGAVPPVDQRQALREQLQQLAARSALPDKSYRTVHKVENDRVETPPATFWRRWVADAPEPVYPEEDRSGKQGGADGLPFDLGQVDIDAMIAAGGLRSSSVEIVHERIAAETLETETPTGYDPPDDFIEAREVDLSGNSDYDWDLRPAGSSTGGDSLDEFWETTAALSEGKSAVADIGDEWTDGQQDGLAFDAPLMDGESPAEKAAAEKAAAEKAAAEKAAAEKAAAEKAAAEKAAAEKAAAEKAAAEKAAAEKAAAEKAAAEKAAAEKAAAERAAAERAAAERVAAERVAAERVAAEKAAAEKAAPVMPHETEPVAGSPTVATAGAKPQLISGTGLRIYHLTESDDLACELDQRLEQLGYELELLDSAAELKEVLGALTPNLVLVDTQFQPALESIGAVLRMARKRASDPIRMLVMCEADTMEARIAGRRAGADELIFNPQTSDEVLAGIERMLHAKEEESTRVLIVEDDRSQGLFAQSILRNAGMQAEVVEDGLKVLDMMRSFQPDLVLMDLHMPKFDGAELTLMIRECDEFVDTPIVFLSGESDQDKHYEALSAGGDDFLSKPIRPKYLIATVNNRVRRARAIRQRNTQLMKPEPFDRGTGLHFRAAMLERLEQALFESAPADRRGGILFIEIEGIPEMRQRLGLSTVEDLLEDAAQFIVSQLGSGTMASRYGDACFVVFDAGADPEALHAGARQLRDAIAFNPFDTPKQMITLDVLVGAADLRQPYADAAAVLNAAERAARTGADAVSAVDTTATEPAPDPVRRERLELLLRDAIEAGRLDLDYQPIVALQGNEQGQYQTLLRLRHEGEASITAAEILPVLREQNRLPEFDRWVLTRALKVITSRLATARPVTLFVSQAIETLSQPDYADWIAGQLELAARAGESLVIEVSVREIGMHLDAISNLCAKLMPQGVRICLSGYSGSEEQSGLLQVFPVDLVKVAPDLVAGLGSSERRAEFGALVEELHERGISVIASRVEDTSTAAVLWMSGIDHIQGNLVQLAGSSLDFDFNTAVL